MRRLLTLVPACLAVFVLLRLAASVPGALTAVISPSGFFELLKMDEISREDIAAERYWTMVDERGREIMVTGRRIHVGDEYISGDNKLYRVHRVHNRTAYARFIREVGTVFEDGGEGVFAALRRFLLPGIQPVQNQKDEGDLSPEPAPRQLIGIYHTHNAESYVPTDGTDSINGRGGIHHVGSSLAGALREKGVSVLHDETLHLPHDRGAYRRSRATTERLLAQGPDVIFDVHRDAAPRRAYAVQIDGRWVTQIQFVVGRQNPNMAVTRQFALDLKRTADQVQPGLIKGIFMARGNYNQDLTPLNLLLEVGAHQNSREAAEDGAALFADVVSFYFYGPEGIQEEATPSPAETRPPGARTQPAARTAGRNILLILGVTAAAAAGFMLLNAGGLEDIKFRLAPWGIKVSRFLQKAKGVLRPLFEPFSPLYRKTLPWLERGDRLLVPWQERIEKVKNAVPPFMARGDQWLLPKQEKIREYSLIVLEKILDLYNRNRNKSRLR